MSEKIKRLSAHACRELSKEKAKRLIENNWPVHGSYLLSSFLLNLLVVSPTASMTI